MPSGKNGRPPIDSVRCAGGSLTSGEENLLNKGRTPFVRKLGRGIFFCRWMADNSRQTISRKTLVRLKTEKVTFYRSKGNLHAGGDAPRRATRKPKKIPPAQRAGARRRSPRSGSAAAGAHITRAKHGKMRADLPPAASGGQGIRHATVTPFTTRTGGVRGS